MKEDKIRVEAANQQLRNEVDILKTSNRRLQSDVDTAKYDSNLQLQMLTNLQNIQVTPLRYTELTPNQRINESSYKFRVDANILV